MRNDEPVADGTDGRTTRRRVLAAAAGLAAAGVAGCSDLTNRTFEATPAVLPEDARAELGLGEVLLESRTTTRQVEAVDGEVTLTSYAVAYTREEAYPAPRPDFGGPSADAPLTQTLVERFLGRVNGTNGPGAGRVVAASALGVDEVTILGDLGIESPRVSLVVTAGAIGEESQPIPSSVFALALVDADEIAVPEGIVGYAAPAKDVLPDGEWYPGGANNYQPSRGWFPGSGRGTFDWPAPDNFSPDARMLVATKPNTAPKSTPEDAFGIPAGEMPGERVEGGETFGSTNPFLVAAPANVALGGESPVAFDYDEVFAAEPAAALPGAGTYGVGVLSTPNAEVAGQSANPLADTPFDDILTHDVARGMLANAGYRGEEFEWADGPSRVTETPMGPIWDYYDGGGHPRRGRGDGDLRRRRPRGSRSVPVVRPRQRRAGHQRRLGRRRGRRPADAGRQRGLQLARQTRRWNRATVQPLPRLGQLRRPDDGPGWRAVRPERRRRRRLTAGEFDSDTRRSTDGGRLPQLRRLPAGCGLDARP